MSVEMGTASVAITTTTSDMIMIIRIVSDR